MSTPEASVTATHHRIVELGEDWADKEAAASLLEETRRSVRAQFAVQYLADGGSVAKAEMQAEAGAPYTDHVERMVEARRAANRARVNYDAAKIWADLVRTKEATKRAEMNMR